MPGAAAVACFLAAVLTEIHLCGVYSCPEILRHSGRGQYVGNGTAAMAGADIVAAGARGLAVRMSEAIWRRPALNGVLDELMTVQSLPSVSKQQRSPRSTDKTCSRSTDN
jgi:hypothetical protein